ncbi:MAG: peptidase domain-containing ABC transporter, partial [Cyanobacteria bacterium P01_A01_bin.37]
DPATGKRAVSYQEFQANWSGYGLLIEPTELLQSFEETQPGTFSKIANLLKSYWILIAQIIVTSLLIQVFSVFTPLLTQVILDRVVVQRSLVTLHVFALGLAFFGIWKVALTAVRQYLLDFLSNRLDLTLMSGFVSHALLLPLKFFSTRHVGDITTRVQESQKLQRFLTRQVIIAWLDASMAFVYVGLMLYYNWKLALLVLGIIPPIVILTLAATPMLRKVSRDVFNNTAKEHSTLVEMITGIATVKTTAVEREMRWQWEDHLTGMLNSRFSGQRLANNLQLLSGLINTLGSTVLLWYGAQLVIQDQLTIGQFVAFNMLIGQVINPILSVVRVWDEYQEAVISVERLNDVLVAQPEESSQHPMLPMPPVRGEICFETVTFRYIADQERNTLENISFQVQAGQTIALVGRSGSGKTTFVNLLQGLYYPDSGRITIDGHDIRHVSPQSLRSQLGVVPQECFLFSGTILENITLHRTRCSLEDVIEVARLAEAHSFIQAMPLGYHTKVGERGTTLSGGQRQRIAIARALLCNPRILILDEATSSLDTESERRFQQNLRQFSRDRTTFVIAHRLSTVRYADHILVLDRGILAEQGTHESLIEQQGLYYHLAHQQLNL